MILFKLTFSNDILDIHVILLLIINVIWMKTYNENTMSFSYYHASSSTSQMHH
jgi:hypothetical protein